jgi:predicted O-methyltransferase YrrM
MSNGTWTKVDEYFTTTFIDEDPILESVLRRSAAAGLPPHHVSPCQAKFLAMLVQIAGARRVLEIGTLGGYSTIWFARAVPSDGQVVTI